MRGRAHMARCQKTIYQGYGKEKLATRCTETATCLVRPSARDNWSYRCDLHAHEYPGGLVEPLRQEATGGVEQGQVLGVLPEQQRAEDGGTQAVD